MGCWCGLNRHGLLIRPCLKTLVFLHLKQKTVQRKKDVEILNKLHYKTLSLKQLIRKPPKRFCKQKIVRLSRRKNNSYKWLHITYEALDVLFGFDVIWSEPRSHAEKKKSNNLLQSKHAGLTSFRWPVVLNDHNFFLQLL